MHPTERARADADRWLASDGPPSATEGSPPAAFVSDRPPAASEPPAPLARKTITFPTAPRPASPPASAAPPATSRPRTLLRLPPRVRGALLLATAAALSYGALTLVLAPADAPRPATVSSPAPLDPSTLERPPPPTASASAAAGKAARAFEITEAPLPPDGDTPAGRGLVEVDSGGTHAIFVEGAFVGRGPVRRIPLPPGEHLITLESKTESLEQTVTVRAGQLVRVVRAR